MSSNASRRRARKRTTPNQPPPPPEPTKEKMLPIRLNEMLIERLDAIRPELIPREPFIRQWISDRLDEQDGEEE